MKTHRNMNLTIGDLGDLIVAISPYIDAYEEAANHKIADAITVLTDYCVSAYVASKVAFMTDLVRQIESGHNCKTFSAKCNRFLVEGRKHLGQDDPDSLRSRYSDAETSVLTMHLDQIEAALVRNKMLLTEKDLSSISLSASEAEASVLRNVLDMMTGSDDIGILRVEIDEDGNTEFFKVM